MMLDPYQILDVSPDASDEIIRKHYLKMVKSYPPEHHPELFEKIRDAYEKVSTHYNRVAYALFEASSVRKQDVLQAFIQDDDLRRPTKDEFIHLLSVKSSKRKQHGHK